MRKLKISLILLSVFIFQACKKDNEIKVISGYYYADCFSKAPLKGHKLNLEYEKAVTGGKIGILAETTVEADGRFSFTYESPSFGHYLKINDMTSSKYGELIQDISGISNKTNIELIYGKWAKGIIELDLKNNYTADDTLYYSEPASAYTINKLVGPFPPKQLLDSVTLSSEGTGDIKLFWAIGYKNYKEALKNGINSKNCVYKQDIVCGERAVFSIKDY